MMHARGQLYTTDALLSIVVFLFGLVVITGLTSQLNVQSSELIAQEVAQNTHVHMVQNLFNTRGIPLYWEHLADRNQVRLVGLVGHGTAISLEKWAAFRDWNGTDYPSLISALGIPDQNFYITIVDSNKTILTKAGTAPLDVNSVTFVSIPSVYDHQPVVVNVQVFQ